MTEPDAAQKQIADAERRTDAAFKEAERYRELWLLAERRIEELVGSSAVARSQYESGPEPIRKDGLPRGLHEQATAHESRSSPPAERNPA